LISRAAFRLRLRRVRGVSKTKIVVRRFLGCARRIFNHTAAAKSLVAMLLATKEQNVVRKLSATTAGILRLPGTISHSCLTRKPCLCHTVCLLCVRDVIGLIP